MKESYGGVSMWQFWLIAAGVFFIGEAITVGFLIFWLGVASLITMCVSFFTSNNYPASVVVDIDDFSQDCQLEQLNGETAKFDDLDALLSKYGANSNVCYVSNGNLDICKKNSKYLVETDKIINNSTIIDIKNNIESGDIYYVNKNTDTKSIQLIINSIIYKDLEIVEISDLISEDYVD